MHFSDLQVALQNAIAANGGRVQNFKTGEWTPIAQDAIDSMTSSMRRTLIFLLSERLGLSEHDAASHLETTDLRPYLALAIDAARRRAQRDDHTRAGNATAHVRRFLRIAFPAQFGRVRSKGGTLAVPAAWQPVLDACASVWSNPQSIRQCRSDVARLARVMFQAGYDSPAALPDRETIERLLLEEGLAPNSCSNSLVAYRTIIAHLQAQGVNIAAAPIPKKVSTRERGLRSLPASAFADLPDGDTPASMSAATLLPRIAPLLADSYEEWRESATGQTRRPATHKDVLRALSLVVAYLWSQPSLLAQCVSATGEPVPALAAFEPYHLWELLFEAPADDVAMATSRAAARAFKHRDAAAVRMPLVCKVIEMYAADVRSTTHVRGVLYAESAIKVFESLWTLTADLYQTAWEQIDRERWATTRSRFYIQRKLMSKANERAPAVTGRKDKQLLVRHISLPLLVCVVLPRFARHVHALEQTWRNACERAIETGHDPSTHARCKRLYNVYEDSLEQYLALAICIADPVRVKNIQYGWLGEHDEFRPTVEYDKLGEPFRITGMQTHFASQGGRNSEALLKQTDKQDRLWRWAPAMIDYDLLLKYIMGPRRARIVAQGLLHDANGEPVTLATYSLQRELAEGGLALFISPDATHPHGAYMSDKVSELCGKALHYALTEILHAPGLPAFEARARSKWRSLLCTHVTRLLWATYWLGVRGRTGPIYADGHMIPGEQIAMDATTDEWQTLKDDYTEVEPTVRDRMRDPAGEWTHPNTYDAWMDRVHRLESIDWRTEPVPLPPAVLTAEQTRRRRRPAPASLRIRQRRRNVVTR